jgi:NADPH-dependent 7-cyano-7-deazaguanine reductase QueF
MLQKFWGAKEKMNENEKIMIRKKERKREKWERNKIKVKKIIKMLLSSFCFISSQVPWWQIHTQIFQPCVIR